MHSWIANAFSTSIAARNLFSNCILFSVCFVPICVQRDYYNQLAIEADVENVRDIIIRIYEDCWARKMEMPNTYRHDVYHIIDDEHFTKSSTILDWEFTRISFDQIQRDMIIVCLAYVS